MAYAFMHIFLTAYTCFSKPPVNVHANKVKILLIGNSITEYNDMPQTLEKMLLEQNYYATVESVTQGGYRLSDHVQTQNYGMFGINAASDKQSTTIKKILSDKWNFIIFQEAPLLYLVPSASKDISEPATEKLSKYARMTKSKIALFQLYTLDEYPSKYYYNNVISPTKSDYCSDSFINSNQEFHCIEYICNKIAKENKLDVVKIGLAFELCKNKYKKIKLYDGTFHPSKEGSYLIACMLFSYITKINVNKLKYCANISQEEAQELRQIANSIRSYFN